MAILGQKLLSIELAFEWKPSSTEATSNTQDSGCLSHASDGRKNTKDLESIKH